MKKKGSVYILLGVDGLAKSLIKCLLAVDVGGWTGRRMAGAKNSQGFLRKLGRSVVEADQGEIQSVMEQRGS